MVPQVCDATVASLAPVLTALGEPGLTPPIIIMPIVLQTLHLTIYQSPRNLQNKDLINHIKTNFVRGQPD